MQQASRPAVKNVTARGKSKPTTGQGENIHIKTDTTTTTTTVGQLIFGTHHNRPSMIYVATDFSLLSLPPPPSHSLFLTQTLQHHEAAEGLGPVPCEPMSTKSHHSHERSTTPSQPMDISEVAGALQRKLQLEETTDDKERANPQFCSEYVQDIYQYLRELEVCLLQPRDSHCLTFFMPNKTAILTISSPPGLPSSQP